MTPTYESSTLIMIGGGVDVANPDWSQLETSQRLAQTYAELAKTRSVLDATMVALGLPEQPRVSVSLIRDTQLMRITVADSLPQRAAAAADEVAHQLVLQSPSAREREEQAYRAFVNKQLADLEAEINALTKAILQEQETGNQGSVAQLQQELNDRRDSYSSLLYYVGSASTNYVRVIEAADVPLAPIAPKIMRNTVLAAIVGLMLAAGAAYLIEYMDDSIKDRTDVEQVLEVPMLGAIAHIPANSPNPEAVALLQPKSAFSEAYRMLRTNLRYSLPVGVTRKVFLVTSIGPSEGKSTTVTNLAVVTAQAGQRTILVDADLRRPSLHKFWHCGGDGLGLSSLLVGEAASLDDVIMDTAVPGLQLVTSGPVPPSPTELLSSPKMAELLEEMAARADVVFLDSPPLMAVADANILAAMATGTIMVVEMGHTRLGACLQGLEVLKKVGGTILGVVLNHFDPKHGDYYGFFGYYPYASDQDTHKVASPEVDLPSGNGKHAVTTPEQGQ